MKNTKLASFTLREETIEILNHFTEVRSINKSALVDRLISEEFKKYVDSIENEVSVFDNNVSSGILKLIKKYAAYKIIKI